MRAVILAAVLLFTPAGASAQGSAKQVDLDFTQQPLAHLLKLLGDVGRVNVLVLEGGDTKLDIKAKRIPWTTAMDDLVKRANLASLREGSVILVGAPAMIEERKKAKKKTFAGPAVDVDFVDVDAADAARLLATATGKPLRLEAGVKPANFRIMRIQQEQVMDLIILQTGAVQGNPAKDGEVKAAAKKCVAAKLPAGELEAIGIVAVGTKRWALLGTKTSPETFIISPTSCVGTEQAKVKAIGSAFVELADQKPMQLHPAP